MIEHDKLVLYLTGDKEEAVNSEYPLSYGGQYSVLPKTEEYPLMSV